MARKKRPALRLPPPTEKQFACRHRRWRVTHTRRNEGAGWNPWPRTRYQQCAECGLKIRTVEDIDVPWALSAHASY
jgi:hypothetical protein